jgi:uncharacterized membrane protein YhaH (DUF805 family)
MKQFLKVLTHYADFSGRANRKECWMFVLFNVLCSFLLQLTVALILSSVSNGGYSGESLEAILLVVGTAYNIAVFPAAVDVLVRRLHDCGRSAARLWLLLIPVAGGIWILSYMLMEGDSGGNRYGAPPDVSGHIQSREAMLRSAACAMILAAGTCLVYTVVSRFGGVFYMGLSPGLFFNFVLPLGLYLLILCAGTFLLLSESDMEGNLKNAAFVLLAAGVVKLVADLVRVFDMTMFMLPSIVSICMYGALTLLSVGLVRGWRSLVRYCAVFTAVFAVLSAAVSVFFNSSIIVMMPPEMRYGVLLSEVWILLPLSFVVLSRAVFVNDFFGTEEDADSVSGVSLKVKKRPVEVAVKGKEYCEADNRGMCIETFSQSQAYWLGERLNSPRKDPFVYYTFDGESDARSALLELPFIHLACDSGRMICDDVFRFGCFAISRDGVLTGQYDAFVAGAGFDHRMWKLTHEVFSRHNGKFMNDLEPDRNSVSKPLHRGNPGNARFDGKTSNQQNTWMVYRAPCKADALSFLSTQRVTEKLYYIIVETPEGNFGRDIEGFYQE